MERVACRQRAVNAGRWGCRRHGRAGAGTAASRCAADFPAAPDGHSGLGPRVINQLLEYAFREPSFWRFLPLAVPAVVVAGRAAGLARAARASAGYVSEVGHDAEMYKRHAGKQQLDADDIRVAIKLKDTQIMRPPIETYVDSSVPHAGPHVILRAVGAGADCVAAERNRENAQCHKPAEHGIKAPSRR